MTQKKILPRPTSPEVIWTDEELATEFAPLLLEQAKLYDADYEWERGWSMYPNHRGGYRLVVSFDPNYKARSDQKREIDPRPKCWTIVYTNNAGRTGLVNGYGSRNFFETLEEARAEFVKTAKDIDSEFRMKEVTKLTPRKAQCASCNKLHDWDEEKQAYYGMWTLTPHREFDDTYDGCRGWD